MAWSASEEEWLRADREDCWRRFQQAVEDRKRGDRDAVVRYLRQVEARAGREVAQATHDQVKRFAKGLHLEQPDLFDVGVIGDGGGRD